MGFRSLIAALALLVGPLAQAAAPTVVPSAKAYWADGWSYCDIHLLARAWGVGEDEASARMVDKLNAGQDAAVQAALQEQRSSITPDGFSACPYWEAGYSYEQAEALGAYWGMDVYEAKARIEMKLIWRNEDILHDEMKAAGIYSAAPDVDPAAMTAFLKSPFSTCDAELLAAAWGTDLETAKASIGSKIIAGYASTAKKAIKTARKGQAANDALCQFWTLPFEYEDAQLLASSWGVDVSEAKTRVESAARAGKLSKVYKALASLRGK
jgi:hypothetical protein